MTATTSVPGSASRSFHRRHHHRSDEETAEVAKYRYHYTRVVETIGRVVRVRIERGVRPSQSHAVAEVLADTMTWTHLAHEVPTR